MQAEALEVAQELELPNSWLNQQGMYFLLREDRPDPIPVFEHPNLRGHAGVRSLRSV